MVIFLYGPDTYRSRQKLKELKRKFIQKRDKQGLNIVNLAADDLNIDLFRRSVLSAGLFTGRRLIIIENFFQKKKEDKNLIQEIVNYLKRIRKDEDNVIIFWDGEIIESDLSIELKEIFDLLISQKYCQEFPLLKDDELAYWIQKEVIKRGGKIQPQAVYFLVREIGPDLWRLSNEIDKLLANNRIIATEDIKSLIHFRLEENIWWLVDAIGEKNKKRALKLLSDQIKLGLPWGELFGMIVRQYRILLQIKDIIGQQKNADYIQVAKKLNLHPFVVKKATKQARNYSLLELKQIYQQLLEIDTKIKTTPVEPEVLTDLLIIKN
ncbi:MAG: DNA polymerase III subunit delta [Patescibacteria group bacterium]